ncbi:ATP-binding protein [Nocardia sp. NPDC057030]|uniref:ATP-binding protein n=1 Tax=unclassified Nocardia TaxID=2637762 RepID=UPI00363EE218
MIQEPRSSSSGEARRAADAAPASGAAPSGSSTPLELAFAADAAELSAVRAALREWLDRSRVRADQGVDVVLAVSEACTNAVEHGHRGDGGEIRLRVWIQDDRLRVTVADTGRWQPPAAPANTYRGRGLPVMEALMDSVTITPGSSGTVVEMATALRRAED